MNWFRNITITIVGLMTLVALAVFATTLTQAFIAPSPEEEMPIPTTTKSSVVMASSTAPSKLIVPSLNVSAKVQKTGITKRGTMAVPTNYTDVGWYRYGTVPGQQGSAVISGHLDNGFGLPGVFRDLEKLKIGDEIIVVDEKGDRLHFRVNKTALFNSNTRETYEVFGPHDSSRLNLITCEGTWDPSTKSYSDRRVVFSELVRVESAK